MRRLVEQPLAEWATSKRRKPLILRGPRQVGKSYSVMKLGRDHFEETVRIDLERNRSWHRVFGGDLAPRTVVSELEILANQRILPGRTLLFLDEIQACPRAIMALRYFYEEMPELHVMAAGSLLEFALQDIPFPVGRIQFLEMHPLNFAEFLWAAGRDAAAEIVLGEPKPVAPSVHEMLLEELRRYCFVGGMPEAVAAYADNHSMQAAFAVHEELCETYRQDFSKYAPRADPQALDAVFTGVALNVGSQIKYSRLTDSHAHTTARRAFDLLCKARVIRPVRSATPAGLPLSGHQSVKRLKAVLVDVGIWQHLRGMKIESEYAKTDLLDAYRGAMAEQFVGQELAITQGSDLFYWSREAKSSSAEVDYLAVMDGAIYGIEVKRGPTGRMRSLLLMLESYPDCGGGLVFSTAPYSELPERKLTYLPLYLVGTATRPADIDQGHQHTP
jgi:predicted AAA+ superfamily ATPase